MTDLDPIDLAREVLRRHEPPHIRERYWPASATALARALLAERERANRLELLSREATVEDGGSALELRVRLSTLEIRQTRSPEICIRLLLERVEELLREAVAEILAPKPLDKDAPASGKD